ncbi:hypothetical protein CONPUDRAFT_79410 [Coniophora puteana RWD-64-598 SS2]|uniref:Uncharacterized protein n=1 Tax=Coniophora puteana (strain RWD-64-598) TaxID=741705 RepID=A0A5M3N882_CONPW|nr:uncharacterized protein CONPUDRAFT_79410 [Coniophora puteana RWD-64-598 SS2]EIW87314.1 hypothetical protein CONPUDRAFT_79410 [Coniophora puteana RWD-64-598 SS2]
MCARENHTANPGKACVAVKLAVVAGDNMRNKETVFFPCNCDTLRVWLFFPLEKHPCNSCAEH